jgi:lipopolysaccharide export system protein LptA
VKILVLVFLVFSCVAPVGIGQEAVRNSPPPKSPRPGSDANVPKGEKNPNDLFGGDKNSSKGPTEITAKDEAQFDVQGRSAVFFGNVKVVDPQFTMTADKLTVHMNREQDGGGLQNAQGEGHVLIVHLNQPRATPAGSSPPAGGSPASGEPVRSTGTGERAIYEAKDGSVTLLGWPQVTQGLNTHIATEPGVKMIIYRDGHMKTYGSTRTVIQDKTEPNKPQTNAAR